MYFGWGAEDDDFTLRMFTSDLCIIRPKKQEESNRKAPFTMLEHSASKSNNARFQQLVNSMKVKKQDGYSNIDHLTEIESIKLFPTFTHLLINVKN